MVRGGAGRGHGREQGQEGSLADQNREGETAILSSWQTASALAEPGTGPGHICNLNLIRFPEHPGRQAPLPVPAIIQGQSHLGRFMPDGRCGDAKRAP